MGLIARYKSAQAKHRAKYGTFREHMAKHNAEERRRRTQTDALTKKFNDFGDQSMKFGFKIMFFPIWILYRAFKKKSIPPESKQE